MNVRYATRLRLLPSTTNLTPGLYFNPVDQPLTYGVVAYDDFGTTMATNVLIRRNTEPREVVDSTMHIYGNIFTAIAKINVIPERSGILYFKLIKRFSTLLQMEYLSGGPG